MKGLINTGGAGSSGHVITDGTTNFEDREFLQFNDVDIQDDQVNNKTIIKPQFRVVTEAEWNLMSPAERNNPNVYWVRPWMSSNEYSSDMSPVGTVISVSCAKTEDGATDSQGDPIYTPTGIYPPESDYLVCDGAPVYINQYPKLAEYFEQAYGTKFYFNAGQTDPQDGTFAIPDWSADFPENGILCIKAQISSTTITYAEIDQSGSYSGEDKVPSCARVAEVEGRITDVVKQVSHLYTYDVGAKNIHTTTLNVASDIPSGYKLIDAHCGTTGNNDVYCYSCHTGTGVTKNTVYLQYRNLSNTNLTSLGSYIDLLCIKV